MVDTVTTQPWKTVEWVMPMSPEGVSHAQNISRKDCTFGAFLFGLVELMCEPRGKSDFV